MNEIISLSDQYLVAQARADLSVTTVLMVRKLEGWKWD